MGKKVQVKAKIIITEISNPERLLIFLDKGEYKTEYIFMYIKMLCIYIIMYLRRYIYLF